MPVSDEGAARLKRLVETVHAHGLAIFDYQLHQRYATAAPEFDLYGLNMAKRPVHQYIPGNNRPGNVRRGPVDDQHNGTVSQGTVFICPKSAAVQDASVHSVARRLDTYGDDGIYLDGTCQAPPCKNLAHGCGYIVEDGSIRTTYPVFGARKIMQRLYVAVKQRSPDNVLDVHCSWGYNPPALAYGDSMWTGEQWYHLRYSGSDYIAGDLSLEQFRSEFTGWQAGTAAETLHYRLGTREKVAAISLLHDIPTRASTRVADKPDPYFQSLQRIWQMRDRFDADHAQVLYYFDNAQYVQTSPEKVHATLLKHPANGVLAFVSNLHRDARTATVQLDLDALGLGSAGITAVNALTDAAMPISEDGTLTIELDTHGWVYVWLRPTKH
jgi:hypothetical protein